MERSSRRDHSRDPEDDLSSDTGASTRLRSRRRDARSSAADSTSDGADTDASSAGQQLDAPQRRGRRRGGARKAAEEPRKSTRELRSAEERHSSSRSGEDEEEDKEQQLEDTGGRKRSLSNVSTTSSASVSSMHSEPLTEEQRRATLDQQVAELEQKRKMVEDGTLAEFCRRVAAFKEERNRVLQTAELHKNLQLKNGQDLYKFEIQRAQHLWENDRQVLKEELLAKVDDVMAKLQADMKALSEPGAKITDINKKPEQKSQETDLDKRPDVVVAVVKDGNEGGAKTTEAEKEEGEVPESSAKEAPVSKRRKKLDSSPNVDPVELSALLPEEDVRLPFDDVTADIAAIVGDRKKTAQSTVERLPNSGNLPFKLERRRLLCGKYVFEDGDEVLVSMPLVHEDYTGTISSITDDAIYIKLASGQKARIFLPHLERRRCELKPLLRGIPSTGSLHSMGWSEYDTFY